MPDTATSPDRIAIVDGPVTGTWLDPLAISTIQCGALASFIGVVRDHHHNRGVCGITYDCYRDMAEKLLYDWLNQARQRWTAELRASIAHATGTTKPGDVAVAIHVATPHRAAALEACTWLIETIKADLPVWKHEHYTDGESLWLPGS